MNWYKIKDRRINMDTGFWYEPSMEFMNDGTLKDTSINIGGQVLTFDSKEERDEELRKLDEALEKGLHTLTDFKLP